MVIPSFRKNTFHTKKILKRFGMAEAAVSFLLEKLADILEEINFQTNVRDEVVRLQVELMRMRCFLRDADAKQDDDERVRN